MPPILLEYRFTPDLRLVLEISALNFGHTIAYSNMFIVVFLSTSRYVWVVPRWVTTTSQVFEPHFAGRPAIDAVQSESLTALGYQIDYKKESDKVVRRRLIALIISTSGIRVAYTVFTCTARGRRNCVKVVRHGLATASSLRKPTARTSRLEAVIKEQSSLAHAVPVPLISQNPLALHPEDGGNK